ncbi:MAG: DUF1501 domain-containing protein [Nostocoides sp.]
MRITGDGDKLTRRQLLIASGVVGGVGLLAGATTIGVEELLSRGRTDPAQTGAKVLVLVTLYGGNDGLNTVIPVHDATYQSQRAGLAYAPADALVLTDTMALNPALKGFKASWDRKQLAVVQGVGYPKPDRSHFRSMDIWQTASPDEPVNTGWIGRWLDATGDDPLRCVNVGSVLPPLAVGARSAAAAIGTTGDGSAPTVFAGAVSGLAKGSTQDTTADALVARACNAELQIQRTLSPALSAPGKPTPSATSTEQDPQSPAGSGGSQSDLGRQLDVAARCIAAGVPTTVYTVSLGGFDTHAAEKGTQEAALGVLDKAVSQFWAALANSPRRDAVVLAVYSEFGRRVQANASSGTDHGTAGPVFLVGAPVRGGLYGEPPNLTDLDAGDLKMTTDFRAVYADLTRHVLDTDPARVLGRDFPTLGMLSA